MAATIAQLEEELTYLRSLANSVNLTGKELKWIIDEIQNLVKRMFQVVKAPTYQPFKAKLMIGQAKGLVQVLKEETRFGPIFAKSGEFADLFRCVEKEDFRQSVINLGRFVRVMKVDGVSFLQKEFKSLNRLCQILENKINLLKMDQSEDKDDGLLETC